ncbi:transposase [Streptomyces sp. NPDC005322]|uniref:transposase n=1 Tax=unclassified Streptomyces TaxID=2593676 RepID=UPI0033BC5446
MKRPQGGGRRRAGGRETLAAIAFVATSGCTWRQLPPVFGPRRQTLYRRVPPVEPGPGLGPAPPRDPR